VLVAFSPSCMCVFLSPFPDVLAVCIQFTLFIFNVDCGRSPIAAVRLAQSSAP
jgi:hypothetical protein